MTGPIELTDSETALYAQVSEAEGLLGVDHGGQRTRLAGVASRELFESLLTGIRFLNHASGASLISATTPRTHGLLNENDFYGMPY